MKVGVITMFYGSSNYGGILQAYALTKAIEKEGDKAEQICYNNFSVFSYKSKKAFGSFHQNVEKTDKVNNLSKNPQTFAYRNSFSRETRSAFQKEVL